MVSWRTLLALALCAIACGDREAPAGAGGGVPARASAGAPAVHYGTEGGQWRSYAADPESTKYSPLARIDAGNFSRLEIAWAWESADVAWREEILAKIRADALAYPISDRIDVRDFQGTPLMVDGVLYGVTSAGQVFSLDAATGAERWVYDPESWKSPSTHYQFLWPKHRGVTYWRDGDDERIFLPTIDSFLLALDAKTGRPVPGFGVGGRVDLMIGLRGPETKRLEHLFQSSPAALYRDTVIVGASIRDRPDSVRGTPGDVRAYDARTGRQKWVFHVVPAEGEPGTETWEDGSWRLAGAANPWGPMSVDPELGAVYVMTSTPTNDLYGGHRLGDNLYAETLLCLDAETGERRWHQQLVRHGLWDYDPGAPPNVVDLKVDGRPVRAVAQVSKQGFTFVFDRATGEPVWPIEDRPVPPSDVPGERAAATQRFPTKPPPFARQGISEDDLIDFTPELRAEALETFRKYRAGPLFTPPSLEGTLGLPGPAGGSNWRGAGFDPETGVLYVTSIDRASVFSVKSARGSGTGFDYVTDLSSPVWFPHGVRWSPDNLPLIRPPYSTITAIDLSAGEILWQVPNGNGPRDHPKLRDLDLPPLGSGAPTCVLVTKTLVVAGDGSELWIPDVGEPIFRAYDKATGDVVGEIEIPARVRGCPMTYEAEGRQYIAVPVADEDHPAQLISLALP